MSDISKLNIENKEYMLKDAAGRARIEEAAAETELAAKNYTNAQLNALKGAVSADFNTLEKIEDKIEELDSSVDERFSNLNESLDTSFDGIDEQIGSTNAKVSQVETTANNALALAQNKNLNKVFETTSAMYTWLANAANKGQLQVGSALYIKEADVPDWWVTEVLNAPNADGRYYNIAPLEAEGAGGAAGSTVSVQQTLTSGAEIGSITVDGTPTKLYAPNEISVDSGLSSTSTNPVQNKIVTTALTGKADIVETTASTAAAAGWYRIAATAVNQENATAIFKIIAAASGYHTTAIITAGISYGYGPNIQVLQCSHYSTTQGISKARIVYHPSYNNTYAYLEVYKPATMAVSIAVSIIERMSWNIVAPSTAGSIPSGYIGKEIALTNNAISAETFVGALSGNAATATKLVNTLAVAEGGTGATDAATARTNLGLGAAATKGVDTVPTDGSSNLITSDAVYDGLINKLSLTGGTLTGDIAIPTAKSTLESSVPVASGAVTISSISELPNYKTYLGSMMYDDTWQNMISIRHRNGSSDGTSFGMYIRTILTAEGNLIWGKQYGASKWQAERTILDSSNRNNYPPNKVLDAGDGRNITFAYSKDGMATTSWLASWNGAQLEAISPANAVKAAGAITLGGLLTINGAGVIGEGRSLIRPGTGSGDLTFCGNTFKRDVFGGDYAGVATQIQGRLISLYAGSSGIITNKAIVTHSDARLKTDCIILDKSSEITDKYLEMWEKLQPRRFKMIEEEEDGRFYLGYYAQEVEEALNNSGLTGEDFVGLSKIKDFTTQSEDSEDIEYFENLYGLSYEQCSMLDSLKLRQVVNEIIPEMQRKHEEEKLELLNMIHDLQSQINELKGGN